MEKQGRISGSLAWRLERGEAGDNISDNYIWTPTENDLKSNQISIKYSPSSDAYVKLNKNNDVIETLKKWESGVNFSRGVFKKTEQDWKMVYICRKG